MPSAAAWTSSPAAARAVMAARVFATLKGPAIGDLAAIRSPLGPITVNVESMGPIVTSSARQSASGWPSAEKVTTSTVASLASRRPYSSSRLTTPSLLRFGVNSCALARK